MTKVRVITSETDFAACMRIRRKVFVDEQNVPEELEYDGLDGACVQFLAEIDGVPLGTARLAWRDDYAKIQRVAVMAETRGTGLGAAIIAAMIDHVKGDGRTDLIRLDSQVSALGFYEKLGFTAFGPIFLDADIDHKAMELRV